MLMAVGAKIGFGILFGDSAEDVTGRPMMIFNPLPAAARFALGRVLGVIGEDRQGV
jgi:hypothetical protein